VTGVQTCALTICNGISISISETKKTYKLSAHYHEGKADQVTQYIACLKTKPAINNPEDLDTDIILQDSTQLYIKTSRGNILLKIDKRKNSPAAVERVKNMCQDIKKILAQ
jgi:hypothetical protein